MPRQSNGQYVAPANTAAVSGQAISSTAFNTLETDIGTEITNSVDRGGRSAMTAALPMGSNKITGMADPTVATDGATKNYVDTTTSAFFSTGDVKLTLKNVADSGWLLFNDASFGSASSGANYSNANCQALFTLFYNNLSDTAAPLFTSGGASTTRAAQVSASAAWAANCRMTLLQVLGRAIAIAGAGAGLTSRALGQLLGEETHTLTTAEIPPHTHSGNTGAMSANANHTHTVASNSIGASSSGLSDGSNRSTPIGAGTITLNFTNTDHTHAFTTDNGTGGGSAHNNMQPTTFFNGMVKL